MRSVCLHGCLQKLQSKQGKMSCYRHINHIRRLFHEFNNIFNPQTCSGDDLKIAPLYAFLIQTPRQVSYPFVEELLYLSKQLGENRISGKKYFQLPQSKENIPSNLLHPSRSKTSQETSDTGLSVQLSRYDKILFIQCLLNCELIYLQLRSEGYLQYRQLIKMYVNERSQPGNGIQYKVLQKTLQCSAREHQPN